MGWAIRSDRQIIPLDLLVSHSRETQQATDGTHQYAQEVDHPGCPSSTSGGG